RVHRTSFGKVECAYSGIGGRHMECACYFSLLLFQGFDGEGEPAQEKEYAAYGSNGAEPLDACEGEGVQGSGKYEYAQGKAPACNTGTQACSANICKGSDGDHPQRMIHLIL